VDFKYSSMWEGCCSNAVIGVFRLGWWKSVKRGWNQTLKVSFPESYSKYISLQGGFGGRLLAVL
jgi:hypothetical protein